MIPSSPVEALGSHAEEVQALIVRAVRSRHTRSAEAHQVSDSRYAMGFGSQWRDLLVDVEEMLHGRGYRSHRLPPAGYKIPVVNDCLVFVWRMPDSADAAASFASSPTRVNSFSAPFLDPTLFEPGFTGELEQANSAGPSQEAEFERVVRDATDKAMPLVLVIVQSSPRQLQSIDWAVAKLDEVAEKVTLHGHESIWAPEPDSEDVANNVESFDSGTPAGPTIEPREQEGNRPDA